MAPEAERTGRPRPAFARALHDELVAAHGRLARRRRRRQLAASAVVVVALVALVPALVPGRTREAAADVLSVQARPDGSTEIAIVDPTAGTRAIAAELDSSGIPNVTVGATTGPSLTGRFATVEVLTTGAETPAPLTLAADHRSMVVPAGFTGRLRIEVGVAAAPGEPYAIPTEAVGEGEPLAGFAALDDATAVLAEARRLGLRVQLRDRTNTTAGTVPAGARTRAAVMVASDTLLLVFEAP